VSSYVECISRLLDDSGLADALEGVGEVYSAAIDGQFRELGRTTERIDGSRPPSEILADPGLAKARLLARRLLNDLRAFGAHSG
jgi:hypothetical protein